MEEHGALSMEIKGIKREPQLEREIANSCKYIVYKAEFMESGGLVVFSTVTEHWTNGLTG